MTSLKAFSTRCSLVAALILASSSWPSASAQPISQRTAQLAPSLETPAPLESSEADLSEADLLESPVQTPSTETDDLTETDEIAIDTVNYADEKISVNYPAAWQLKMLDDGILLSSIATTPADLVATQIVRIAASPGAVVNANIESFTAEGSAVSRYTRANIDGHDALVMWLTDRPDELGSAIATFIGYGNETVLLFSRYAPENTAAEADILQIHTSFTDPVAAAAFTEDATAPNTADTLLEATPAEVNAAETSNIGEVIVPANSSPSE